jgi:hypothetical protein
MSPGARLAHECKAVGCRKKRRVRSFRSGAHAEKAEPYFTRPEEVLSIAQNADETHRWETRIEDASQKGNDLPRFHP